MPVLWHRSSRSRQPARAALLLTGVLGAGLAAACSTSPTVTTHHGGVSQRTTTTTISTGASNTTTPVTLSNCHSITAAAGSTQGAAGTIVGTVIVTNASSGTCTILGYPSLFRFGANGAPVPVTVVEGITVNIPGSATEPPALVTLAASAEAEFTYQYSDVQTGGETSCATSTTMAVSTPGSDQSAPFALTMAPCSDGTVHVSPVYTETASG